MSREKENGEERKLMQRCRNLSERVAQHNRRMKAEEQALKSETSMVFVELKERIGKAKEACKTSHSEGSEEEMAELMAVKKVLQGQGPGGDLRVLNVSTRDTPILVRNMLGNHAAGVLNRHDQRLQLKEEYFKFRRRTGIVFTIVPTILSFGLRRAQQLQLVGEPFSLSPPLYVSLQVYAVWLVYFYCSMALRENILVMNGSDIRSWWIQHHYVMLAFMLVLITLPIESEAFKIFARKFTDFNVLQGFIMMFQNRYQARRLYRQIALGRNSAMDVVSSDASPGKGHLLLLYPALFVIQGLQLYVAWTALSFSFEDMVNGIGWLDEIPASADLRGARGVFVCGSLFMVLAVGNFTSTVATIVSKARKSKKRLKASRKVKSP